MLKNEVISLVHLRAMRQEEYPDYCQYFIADYSQEIATNYGHSMEMAIELAKADLLRCFPNGLETAEHDLLCIEINSNDVAVPVGYLWHSINQHDHSTFIYDFFISEEYRGKGIGKSAIEALERQLLPLGIKQIKLRVAYHNSRALKLYQEVGFAITGYNMAKTITSN
ncbi:Acetyltransferase [Vibrio tapetis subsp. tapetis]|uniref:Acetyltransferase n=1 Tax=Vibrio tapetis subsp. tapetis TaxID=1671868 RepID=A0A2N8ZJC0_9VIBR|nr:Acetyltransferase [Vibrio tapetis subsp. tapetis]